MLFFCSVTSDSWLHSRSRTHCGIPSEALLTYGTTHVSEVMFYKGATFLHLLCIASTAGRGATLAIGR